MLQELTNESHIVIAHVGETCQHLAAAEYFYLEILAAASGAEYAIDQLLHRGGAVTRGATS
jgi:hypothetical protein